MAWPRSAKIAFIGSHSVRKSNAVHAFASTIGRAGRSVEVGREVIRDNPLGLNEGATPEAQLWVLMAQVQQELELAKRADVLVTDRSVVDNFAYYLRVTAGEDPSGSSRSSGAGRRRTTCRSAFCPTSGSWPMASARPRTNSATRSRRSSIGSCPVYLPDDRCLSVPASQVTADFDWWAIAERLAGIVGAPLVEGQLSAPLG